MIIRPTTLLIFPVETFVPIQYCGRADKKYAIKKIPDHSFAETDNVEITRGTSRGKTKEKENEPSANAKRILLSLNLSLSKNVTLSHLFVNMECPCSERVDAH